MQVSLFDRYGRYGCQGTDLRLFRLFVGLVRRLGVDKFEPLSEMIFGGILPYFAVCGFVFLLFCKQFRLNRRECVLLYSCFLF